MKVLVLALLLTGCAHTLKAPKAYVRAISQTLPLTATLSQVQMARPILYFASFDPKVAMYRVEYLTPAGKVPFYTKFKSKDSIKDTVRCAPCYVRVQALGDGKPSWSKTIYVE